MTVAAASESRAIYRHEALIYAGEDEFVERASSFLRDGAEASEPMLVVVSRRKIDRLRESLNGHADDVLFIDMAEVGANPARIIPAWRDFVEAHASPGVRLRGIGEPIYPERDADELVECQRHESLLNLAFADTSGFWLLCPYDATALSPDVVEEARRSHPYVMDGVSRESVDYRGLETIAAPFGAPLPRPSAAVSGLPFGPADLGAVRAFVRRQAAEAALGLEQQEAIVLAVNELATNSIRYGGGRGRLRIWLDGGTLIAEVKDEGRAHDPLLGRVRPPLGSGGGYGLWLANQLCDLVQIRDHADGTTIRLRLRRR